MTAIDERILSQIGRRGTGFIQDKSWCSDIVGGSHMSEIEEIEDGPKEKNIDMTESDILVVGPEDCYQEYFPENEHQVLFDYTEKDMGNKIENQSFTGDNLSAASVSWAKYTPSMLKQPKANALCTTNQNTNANDEGHTKKRKQLQDKLTLWAKNKVTLTNQRSELEKCQLEFQQELWKKKLQTEDLLKKEIENRIQFAAEEHAAKMAKFQAETELLKIQKTVILKDALL
ncbi:uncharacterized protein LOC126555663 [Aphis gossypii]|uniref:uncharacterized protein LOC126555663 n=1 Tax=Aphis gossypii TaxID=80765 RepID=UPI002158ED71|nr:uncharacterized protein LOC126555663 [Aphis gossypii]